MAVFVKASSRARAYTRAQPRTKGLTGRKLSNVLKARTYVLQTREFGGHPVYIGEGSATDTVAKATRYSGIDKLSSVKLPYMKAVTGYKRLRFKRIK